MDRYFKSSILRFGPIFTPYHIIVGDNYITYYRNNGIGSLFLTSTSVSLKISKITNIIMYDKLFWNNLELITSSGVKLLLKHFTKEDVVDIKNLIHK